MLRDKKYPLSQWRGLASAPGIAHWGRISLLGLTSALLSNFGGISAIATTNIGRNLIQIPLELDYSEKQSSRMWGGQLVSKSHVSILAERLLFI